jgi:hypothetical protein
MTSTTVAKRFRRSIALAVLLAGASLPAPAWSGCGRDHGHAADAGLQVQVDPKSGAYSMPEAGTLPADPAAGARERAVVVSPGETAAGGYKVKVGEPQLMQAAPPAESK